MSDLARRIDQVFKAYDVRAIYPDPLDEQVGWRIGWAFGKFMIEQNDGKSGTILVSRDHRPAAPKMCDALINGLRGSGVDVVDLGRADTSFMYFAIPYLNRHDVRALGGVQTTASHNPIQYIGYKISGEQAKPIGSDTGLREIQTLAADAPDACPEPTGKLEVMDLWGPYKDHVLSFLEPKPHRKLTVFADVCNGMGIDLMAKVFHDVYNLKAVTINDRFTDEWAHEPNPLVAENVVPTQEGVKQHGADLGAAFDGDADRCMLVDDQGEICGCDHLTAWLAEHFLEHQPGSAIIYDLRSSKVVAETVQARGGKPVMSKVGHVNIKAKLRETDGIFGGELSGHFYFKHNAFADSGAITLAATLAVLGQSDKPLSELIAPYRKYPQSGEINFENDDKEGAIASLKADFGQGADAVLELDGVSIDRWETDGYWFNVRPSNTEPLLRLNAEARDKGTLAKLLDELKPRLGTVHHGH
jgi:phosphomannomutase